MNKYITASAILASTALTACSGSNSGTQFLKSLNMSITQSGNASYVNLTANVDLGSVQFNAVSIGVVDPKTGNPVGSVTFGDTNGVGQIGVSVNADLFTHGDASIGNSLPNGSPLPTLLNLTPGQSLGIDLSGGTRIYVGGDLKSKVFLGVAVAIPGLNSATSGISFPANIFFSVPFGTTTTGVAGLYTSPTAADNGVAVFGEYVPAVTPPLAAPATILNNPNFAQAKAKDYADYENIGRHNQKKLMNFFYGKKHVVKVQ